MLPPLQNSTCGVNLYLWGSNQTYIYGEAIKLIFVEFTYIYEETTKLGTCQSHIVKGRLTVFSIS